MHRPGDHDGVGVGVAERPLVGDGERDAEADRGDAEDDDNGDDGEVDGDVDGEDVICAD